MGTNAPPTHPAIIGGATGNAPSACRLRHLHRGNHASSPRRSTAPLLAAFALPVALVICVCCGTKLRATWPEGCRLRV
jgi:hypothetical protein